jgi:hypothetical protein
VNLPIALYRYIGVSFNATLPSIRTANEDPETVRWTVGSQHIVSIEPTDVEVFAAKSAPSERKVAATIVVMTSGEPALVREDHMTVARLWREAVNFAVRMHGEKSK